MTQAFPLHWPKNQARTPSYQRKRARFDLSIARSVENLLAEIRRMGGTIPVISTDLELRRDGLPYSGQREPADQGAAAYFTLKNRTIVIACDRWDRIADNIQAIAKTIEALRGIQRWGTTNMVEAAFAGFVALPAPNGLEPEQWQIWFRTVAGYVPGDLDELSKAYRGLAKKYEADQTRLRDLNIARDAARKELA